MRQVISKEISDKANLVANLLDMRNFNKALMILSVGKSVEDCKAFLYDLCAFDYDDEEIVQEIKFFLANA